jgi:hypothetical protein
MLPALHRGSNALPDGYTDDQIHRILLEFRFFFTIRQICEKWGITPYRLRKWRKRDVCTVFSTLEDCIIAGIHRGGSHAPAELIGWLDYRDHAIYSEAEVLEMFEALEARGEVRRDGDRFAYIQLDPPYIFGPRPAWQRSPKGSLDRPARYRHR